MSNLKQWENIIKEKRKQTNFRDFLREICSWSTLVIHKNNGIISKFPKTNRIKSVVSNKDFEKNRDDLINNGIDYDFDKNFFENYSDLFKSIDIFDFINYGLAEKCFYSDMVVNSKNVYLSFTVINNCENIYYSFSVKDNCNDIFNSISVYLNSSIVYFSSGVNESYKIFYSRFIYNSNNIWFSSNLTGCSECIFCNNLDNCSYYIENKKYEKVQYLHKKKEILKDKNKYFEYYSKVEKIGKNYNSTNVNGSGFYNSIDVKKGYYGYNVKNGNNLLFVGGISGNENMFDVITAGSPTSSDLYGIMGANGNNLYLCMNATFSSNIYYSYFVTHCSFCFGCIGLKNKSYCILNKQYSKEDFEILADKIFLQMRNDGILGNFFPGKINPFYFNDTMAGLLGDFSKDEVEKEGFMWRDQDVKVDIPEGSKIVETKELYRYEGFDKDGNWYIVPEIMKLVIKDEKGNIYRIVKMEYDFLIKYELPLPRIHWKDRIKLNFGI